MQTRRCKRNDTCPVLQQSLEIEGLAGSMESVLSWPSSVGGENMELMFELVLIGVELGDERVG